MDDEYVAARKGDGDHNRRVEMDEVGGVREDALAALFNCHVNSRIGQRHSRGRVKGDVITMTYNVQKTTESVRWSRGSSDLMSGDRLAGGSPRDEARPPGHATR